MCRGGWHGSRSGQVWHPRVETFGRGATERGRDGPGTVRPGEPHTGIARSAVAPDLAEHERRTGIVVARLLLTPRVGPKGNSPARRSRPATPLTLRETDSDAALLVLVRSDSQRRGGRCRILADRWFGHGLGRGLLSLLRWTSVVSRWRLPNRMQHWLRSAAVGSWAVLWLHGMLAGAFLRPPDGGVMRCLAEGCRAFSIGGGWHAGRTTASSPVKRARDARRGRGCRRRVRTSAGCCAPG